MELDERIGSEADRKINTSIQYERSSSTDFLRSRLFSFCPNRFLAGGWNSRARTRLHGGKQCSKCDFRTYTCTHPYTRVPCTPNAVPGVPAHFPRTRLIHSITEMKQLLLSWIFCARAPQCNIAIIHESVTQRQQHRLHSLIHAINFWCAHCALIDLF